MVGGSPTLKYLNIIGLTIIPIYSVLVLSEEGITKASFLSYLLPFFIVVVLILITKGNKYITALVYLFIGVGTTIDPSNIGDYSGAIFFLYSYHQLKNKKYGVFLLLMTPISLTFRATSHGGSVPQIIEMMAAFGFIYAIYYYLNIHESVKKHTKVVIDKNKVGIDPIVIRIVQLRALEYDWWEINDILKLNVTDRTICSKVSRERKKQGFKNQEAFAMLILSDSSKDYHICDNEDIDYNKSV